METLLLVMICLITYQVKHLLADYFLQTKSMLKKFSEDPEEWVPALIWHCNVHSLMTFAIVFCFTRKVELAISLSIVDFSFHFIMDRIKASPKLLGQFKPLGPEKYVWATSLLNTDAKDEGKKLLRSNVFFWWCLGIDQTVHHLTHYLIIWVIFKNI